MKGQYLLRGIRNVLLGAILVFGVTTISSTAVNAQRRFGVGFHGGGFRTRVFIEPMGIPTDIIGTGITPTGITASTSLVTA